MLSEFPHQYAEDRRADNPVVEAKDKSIKRNEYPMESDTIHNAIIMVGPSVEEIHDFLYQHPRMANL